MIIPAKLKKGDTIRVITPARSFSMPWLNNDELKEMALKRFKELGLNVTFGKYIYEMDEFNSSTIEHRVEDIHDAFRNKGVKMIISVIGGFNSNQLLRYLDYDLIKDNPKIICGYSDITALINAINAKSGLVTYLGPAYFNFGDIKGFDQSLEYFKKCLMDDKEYEIIPSLKWSDDLWAGNQENRVFIDNEGYWLITEGEAEGTIVGGNQCTLNLLQGTEYMPSLKGSILFIEDDSMADIATFDRDLQSLIHLPDFNKVEGIVIGRFQKGSNVTLELLTKSLKGKKELDRLPIIANADFGHTSPIVTLPIGGRVNMNARKGNVKLRILEH